MIHRVSGLGLLVFLPVFAIELCAQPAAPPGDDEPAGRRVYVPVEDLDVILEHDKRGVILPRAEFLKLAAEAKKNLDDTPQSPHKVVVAGAQYSVRVEEDQLVVSAVIELNQLARGWQMVTLPYRGLAVEGATLDDKPAKIGRSAAEGRPLVVLLHEAGTHTLKLKLSTPLVTLGSDKVAAFGLAPIAAATMNMSLPPGKFLHVDEVPLERSAAADEAADYSVPLGGKSAVALRITDRRTHEDSASLVFAGTAIGLHVAPEERTWRAVTSLNVYGKPIDNLTFVVPKSLDIISVESTGLERWEIGDGPGGTTTTLKLVYRQPFSESRGVIFTGVSASVIGQPWSVPTLSLNSATSHLVRVLVQHPASLRLQQVEATSVRRVGNDEAAEPDMPVMPDMGVKVGSNQQLHYAAWREDFSLLFVTQPRARELQATIATRIDINNQELALHASVVVQTRFAPLFDFDLALPVDWTVTDVLVENRPVPWRVVPIAAGLNQVRVLFNAPIPADGKVNLLLSARLVPGENWPIEETPLTFKLPEVTLPEVGVTDGRYMIAAEDDLDLVPEDVTGLDPVRLSVEEQRVAGAPRLVYEYQDTRFGGTLKVSRKALRVAAQTLAFHRLDRETLVSHLEARMVVQGGGLQKLQVALPEATGTNLRFSLVNPPGMAQASQPRITEQTSAAPADGQRLWTLQLDQRAFGLLWLVVDLTAPRDADAQSFDLPGLRIVAADRQNGFVAVEGGPDQQLEMTTAEATGQPLVEVDPADIPVAFGYVPQERIVASYRAVRPGFRVSVKETRYDRRAVPTAVCDAARLTSVVGESGQRQHKAEFMLRAVGVQSLRVELPAEADLWATLIDGRPIEVRVLEKGADGRPAWIVPLPQASDPGQAHAVQLFYRTNGESLESSGTLSQIPPRIAAISGQGETQPIEILVREWTLFHPAETEITSSSGQFEPLDKPTRISFLGLLHQSISLASPTRLWQKALWTALVGGAIGIFFFAYRRRGVAGAAVTVAVGMVVAMVVGITFFTFPGQEHSSSQYYADSSTVYAPTAESAITRNPINGGAGIHLPAGSPEMAGKEMVADHDFSESKDELLAGMPQDASSAAPATESSPSFHRPVPARTKGSIREAADRFKDSGGPPRKSAGEAEVIDGTSNTIGVPRFGGFDPSADSKPTSGATAGVPGRGRAGNAGFGGGFGGATGDGSNSSASSGLKSHTVRNRSKTATDVSNGLANTFGQPLPPFGIGQTQPPLDADFNGKPSPPSGDMGGLAARGALLSLAIDLPVTSGSRKTAFRYTGAPPPAANPALEVEYQNRRAISFVSFAWQAGMLLLFWFARNWSAGVRATLAVLGLVAPLALVSLVPIDALPYLDGIFLGTLWGLLLWVIIVIFTRLRHATNVMKSEVLRRTSALIFATAVACGFANQKAHAQDAQPQANATAPNEGDTIARPGATTIVVPYDPGEDPLKAARVFLPWAKFLELWNAAHPDKAAHPPAPVDGLVAEALYAAAVPAPAAGKKPVAEVSGRFVLYSFRDDQISLVLPVGRVPLTEAQLDGKAAPLVTRDEEGRQELTVVVATRGVHILDVKFTLPVEQAGAAGKFTLPTQPIASGSLRFTLPAKDLNLRVSGGATSYRKVREKEQTIAIVPIDQGGDVSIAWTPAQAREAAQGIVHVESATALSLGDAGMRLSTSFKYTVRQGALADVAFSLPPGLLVRQIAGLDLGGWEIAGENEQRTLKVFLRRPVNDSTTLQFDLYQAQPFTEQTQIVAVPQFVPQGVTRETGTLGVFAERQLVVTAGAASGLAQIDLSQFVAPAPISPPPSTTGAKGAPPTTPLFAYRFAARPVQLQLLVARQKPKSKGTAEHAVFVAARKLRMASRLELHLAGAPRSEIAVQLPPGYLLYDLKSNDAVDYHVEARPGEQEGKQNGLLIVELSAPRTGAIELVLDGIVSRAPDDISPKIGVPVPLGIDELRSSLAVWLDRIYTARLEDSTGWKSVDPGELPERLRGAQNIPVQFAFTSTLTGLQPVGLTLDRAVPRLSGDALSVVIARDTSVQYLLYLRWNIAAAGESTFVFTTPDWLAERLEIDRNTGGVRIRQVLSEKIAGNLVRWTVTLDDPRTTVSTLVAQAVLPPPDAARIAAPSVIFEQATAGESDTPYQPLEQQHQYVVLVNQSPQRLEQEARDAVEAIPAVDLPIKISQAISDQATEILRVRDPKAALGWRVQGVQQLKSLAASVNLAKMTLVIARDGSWRGEAYYRINNRARQFLALTMPPGSRILSLFVAHRPSRPIDPKRAGEPELVLVPLPKTAAGDLAVEVKLVYAGAFEDPLPKGVQVRRSDLDLPAPQVVSQGEFGIPVAATEWTVILPPDIDARRIEDATRSNLAESDEGGEELIARYNELWNMYSIALTDDSQSMNVQSRVRNNLKQLSLDLHNYSDVDEKVSKGDNNVRQQGMLLDLKSKVKQAEKQWQDLEVKKSKKEAENFKAAGGISYGGNAGYGNFFSNKDVQRDLIVSNSSDFQTDSTSAESEALPQINLQPALPKQPAATESPAQDAGQAKGKSHNPNRRELREQAQAQSMQLNDALNAPQTDSAPSANQPGSGTVPGQKPNANRPPISQDADADDVLEMSNAKAAAIKKSEQRLKNTQIFQGGTAAGSQAAEPPRIDVPFGGPDPLNAWLYSPEARAINRNLGVTDMGGAMGGMGGGMGMGVQDGTANELAFDSTNSDVAGAMGQGLAGWTTAGGLSLDMAVPQEGQKLTFSKSGGDARLALGLRPRAALETGFGLAWTTVWLVIGLGLIAALARADAFAAVVHRLPPIMTAVGLAWYFLLPAAAAGFALFVVGAVCLGWQHRRA